MTQMISIRIVLFAFLSTTNGFDLQCPHPSQRTYRIQSVCNGNSSAYTCLYDTRKKGYVEFCADIKDNYVRAGLKYVISGTFRNVECSDGRYQPVKFWSNQSSVCMNLKSKCNDFGEIVYSNSSSIYDATSRCDYTRGYAFVSETRNKCFCVPSEEDCSCYIKQCPTNTTLSPDYECIYVGLANTKFYCQPVIKRQKHENETDMAVLFKDNQQWRSWKRFGRIYLAGLILGYCVISGILVVVYLVCDGIGGIVIAKAFRVKEKRVKTNLNENTKNESPKNKLTDFQTRNQNVSQSNKAVNKEDPTLQILNSKKNWNVDTPNSNGKTPLMDACGKGYLSIVERLIESGADINLTDTDGRTTFYWSCIGGNVEIVNFLIDKGCNIHKPNVRGKTPLMDACGKGYLSIVERLIECGADINLTDTDGRTTFYWSSIGGNIDIVNLLMKKGYEL